MIKIKQKIVMKTETKVLYETPTTQPVELGTEGIICQSNPDPYARGGYPGIEI